jgi:hypothetical protein
LILISAGRSKKDRLFSFELILFAARFRLYIEADVYGINFYKVKEIKMINKIKSLFLLALCVAFIGAATSGVSAQNRIGADKVLAAGKKPLLQSDIETLVEFHEWIFDTAFTRDERRTFQSFIVDEFRGNAAATRRNADEVIKTMRQIRALDADKQRRVREMTISDYLKDLRATGDDADSQFLLGIYERGQNGGNKGKVREVLPSEEDLREAENPSTNRGVGSGAGSPKLVGKWKRSVGAGRGDDGTGKTTYESGTSYTFEFFADGTMHFLSEMKVLSIVQCRVTKPPKFPAHIRSAATK